MGEPADGNKIYRHAVGPIDLCQPNGARCKASNGWLPANALTGPNRWIRSMRRLRALFIIASDRQRPCVALVVGRRRAAFARSAIDARRSLRPSETVRNRCAEL